MDYEKAYKAVLQTATQWIKDGCTDKERICLECVFPELRESEDERIRKQLIETIYSIGNFPHRDAALAYLEKQKENIEKEYIFRPLAGTVITTAAEQAIRRAKEGEHLVLAFNGAYIPVREYNSAKELIDEYDTYRKKRKEQKTDAKSERVIKAARHVLNNWLDGTDCPDVSGDFTELEYAIREYDGEEKQKEPHYTKRNALFDKCVENCDPMVMKEVSDKIDEMLEKEQKPELPLMGGDTDTYFDDLRMTTKPLTSREWFDEGIKYAQRLQKEQKPAEWSEEDEAMIKSILFVLESYVSKAECEQSPTLTATYPTYYKEIDWLKSLRPSWKPSEEQMSMLLAVINDPNNAGAESCHLALISIYEHLKGLM